MKVSWFDKLPPRRKKQVLWSAGLLLFYTLFGFLILPPIVRSIAVKQASKALQREVTIEKVKLNPYAFSATIRGLLVKDKDGEPFVSWDEVYANFQLSSLFSGGWDFKEFRLKSPYARVQVNKDGTLNISDLLVTTNPPTAKSDKKPRPLRVGAMQLTNVVLSFTDLARPTPFTNRAGIVELVVDRFSTAPNNDNPYSFAGTSADGESFSWKGNFSVEPLRSQGNLTMGGVILKKYRPYHEDKVRFDIRDGTVDLAASYQIALGGETNLLQVTNASITLKGLKIAEKGGDTNLVEVPFALLSGARCDLYERIAELKQFTTECARFDLRRAKDGRLNLVDLFTPLTATNVPTTNTPLVASAPATNSRAWQADIGAIVFRDYSFSFEDQTTARPMRVDVDKITLAVTNVSNQPGTNTTVDLSLRWNTNGTIKTSGTVALFPPSGELQINLDGIQLLPLDRYLDHFLNLTIHGGSLALKGVAKFAMPSNGPVAASFSGDFHLADFASKEVPEAVDFAKWRGLALRGIDLHLGPPIFAVVNELVVDEPFLRFAKDAKTNNIAAILRQRSAATNAADATARGKGISAAIEYATSAPPIVIVKGLAISNGVVQISDEANTRPVRLLIEGLGLKLKNVSNQPGTNTDIALALRFNTNGTVKTEGTVALYPPTADLKLNVDGVALRPLDPYLDSFVNLLITRGALGIDGRARVSLPSNAPMAAAFQGDVRLRDFATVDGVLNEEFVKWGNLNLRGLDFQLDPMAVTLREVGVNDLLLRFVLGKDTNNVAGLVKKPAAPVTATADQVAPAPPVASASAAPKINVTSLVLSNANLEFKDASITPTALLSVRQLTGTVGGLSSERAGSGTLDLKGKVDNTAPFEIAGKISLLTHDKDSDIKVAFKDVEMAPMGPYIAKYLGYRLTRGRFNVNMETLIQGRKIDAKNVVVFDQFTLGESVPGTNAVKAPIKLALAIMKDSQGKIELDLPVEGDLDDPNYRYGKILWRAIRNVFLKAATSPFALLGAAFGGKGEELSFQDFDPGLAELKVENTAKLDTVAKALQNRPALGLDINGSFDPAADGEALRREKLLKEFRGKKFEQLRAAGQTDVAPEEIKLAPVDYANAVLLAYASGFSTNASVATNLLALAPAFTNLLRASTPASKPGELPPPAKDEPSAQIRPEAPRRGAAALLSVQPKPSPASPASKETKRPGPVIAQPLSPSPGLTNLVTNAAALSFAEMENALLAKVEVTDSDLNLLAAERAKKVKEYLLEKGQIAPERLFLAENPAAESATNRASRVFLQLK